ncbi:hypothetical protein GE09DRAFT_396635 [Coniochaeta sp. 2T2.1]|nr:hypothetical protein GE09DRAFT_396635 [Coniochaeta sp. 2T2.1]
MWPLSKLLLSAPRTWQNEGQVGLTDKRPFCWRGGTITRFGGMVVDLSRPAQLLTELGTYCSAPCYSGIGAEICRPISRCGMSPGMRPGPLLSSSRRAGREGSPRVIEHTDAHRSKPLRSSDLAAPRTDVDTNAKGLRHWSVLAFQFLPRKRFQEDPADEKREDQHPKYGRRYHESAGQYVRPQCLPRTGLLQTLTSSPDCGRWRGILFSVQPRPTPDPPKSALEVWSRTNF